MRSQIESAEVSADESRSNDSFRSFGKICYEGPYAAAFERSFETHRLLRLKNHRKFKLFKPQFVILRRNICKYVPRYEKNSTVSPATSKCKRWGANLKRVGFFNLKLKRHEPYGT